MLVLSPRAVERLESYTPPWPLPKLFRLTSGGKLNEGIFQAATINTPSMMCVEDQLDALAWGQSIGGLPALIARSRDNLGVVAAWIESTPWVDFLAREPATRSNTSICLSIVDPWFQGLDAEDQTQIANSLATLLAREQVAHDIGSYRDAPPGLRIWAGATIEQADLASLMPWLDWAWSQVKE